MGNGGPLQSRSLEPPASHNALIQGPLPLGQAGEPQFLGGCFEPKVSFTRGHSPSGLTKILIFRFMRGGQASGCPEAAVVVKDDEGGF